MSGLRLATNALSTTMTFLQRLLFQSVGLVTVSQIISTRVGKFCHYFEKGVAQRSGVGNRDIIRLGLKVRVRISVERFIVVVAWGYSESTNYMSPQLSLCVSVLKRVSMPVFIFQKSFNSALGTGCNFHFLNPLLDFCKHGQIQILRSPCNSQFPA